MILAAVVGALGASLGGCDDLECPGPVHVLIQAPTTAVLEDSDLAAPGVQTDVRVRTTLAEGRSVTVEVVAPDGRVVDTAVGAVDAEGAVTLAGVTLPAGTAILRARAGDATCGAAVDEVTVDVRAGLVALELVRPALACGATVTPAADSDLALDGVQVIARVASPGAASRMLELTNGLGMTSLDAAGEVSVTLAPGPNQLVGVALDGDGARAETAGCALAFADLSVNFAPPAADGTLGRADGMIVAHGLRFKLCGTVNRPGAAVRLSIDGGSFVGADDVSGTTWCKTLVLDESPPAHTIIATATAGASNGTAALVVSVDLTPPQPVAGLVARKRDRRTVELSFPAPGDGAQPVAGYLVKHAPVPLTEATFDDAAGSLVTSAALAPGAPEVVPVGPLRTGAESYVAIAAVDAAGNRSPAAFAGPLVPAFDQTGAIHSPDQNQGTLALGAAIAHGRFNDDDYADVAVGAPLQNANGGQSGAVLVYFGSPTGLGATPGLVIRGPSAGARFGSALAAIRRPLSAYDDLVIGAPQADGNRGRIYVFEGGAAFGASGTGGRGDVPASAADSTIGVRAAAPGFFAGSRLGSRLAAADLDGDGLEDLVASAPLGGGGRGGIAIIYGGTITGPVELSDVDDSEVAAIAELIADPGTAPNRRFGFYLHAVGRTQGDTDPTDDLVVAYFDDDQTIGDSLYVLRGDGTRPLAPGLSLRAFAPSRDVRIDLGTAYRLSEWGSQVTSIADLDGDGVRDLVIGAYRNLSATGQVWIVSGDTLGASGVVRTSDPGVVITQITGTAGSRFGALIARHDAARTYPDIDGDGREDLIVAGVGAGGSGRLFVWFGGALPTGNVSLSSATHIITGPTQFQLTPERPQGPAGVATWIGDINGDGLDDVCWSSPFDNTNGGDGGFEVLWDRPL